MLYMSTTFGDYEMYSLAGDAGGCVTDSTEVAAG
jgi:hypothetical protein